MTIDYTSRILRRCLSLLAGVLLTATRTQAQKAADDVWTRFQDPKTKKVGYRDSRGVVRVKPRFDDGVMLPAQRLRHITAISEGYHQAYLLKTGRLVARDSAYVFDFSFDCEREGYILFKDRKKDRVGFLDQRGKPVIPAGYNYASSFHNGLAVVQKGARRHCSGEPDTLHCEHLGWQGGVKMLINTRNEVLVPNLAGADLATLNWYSLNINPTAADTLHRVRLVGTGGTVYSFVDYQREFRSWFYRDFLPALRTGDARQLADRCFTDLSLSWQSFDGWHAYRRDAFVAAHGPLLKAHLGSVETGNMHVSYEWLFNDLIHNQPSFAAFQTSCAKHDAAQYPVFEVHVRYDNHTPSRADDYQEHFSFIRTPAGYRLFEMTVRKK